MELKGKVIAGKVLVKPIEKPTQTTSGLFYIQSKADYQGEGEIVSIGESLPDEKIEVQVGDKVIYFKSPGIKVDINGESYTLIFHKDILFIR
jgi:chaperonin GroES